MPEVKEGGEFWFGKNGPPFISGYKIDLDMVINDQKNPGYMIRFAQQLKRRTYIHPREFFEYLTKHEIEELLELSNQAVVFLRQSETDYDKYKGSASKILDCAALLAKAEGESVLPFEVMQIYCGNFMSLLAIHKFGYLGVVKPKYENFTVFGTNRELFDKSDEGKDASKEEDKPKE